MKEFPMLQNFVALFGGKMWPRIWIALLLFPTLKLVLGRQCCCGMTYALITQMLHWHRNLGGCTPTPKTPSSLCKRLWLLLTSLCSSIYHFLHRIFRSLMICKIFFRITDLMTSRIAGTRGWATRASTLLRNFAAW